MNNAIKKIIARAKQLQRKHPNAKWINLIKTASAEYRGGHIGRMQKHKQKSKSKKVSGMTTRKKMQKRVHEKAAGAGLTIQAAKHFIREELKDQMGRAYVRQQLATHKRVKKKIGKQIAKYRSEIKKLD